MTSSPRPNPSVIDYNIPEGCYRIPDDLLDLRSDDEIDAVLQNPPTIDPGSDKNIWFFWHSGFKNMHGYTQRNVRAWHRRFSKHGWVIRVVDRVPNSPCNVSEFLDVTDINTFPRAFIDGTLGGKYGPQHTSDLVRWPLLLKHGGVYADVGLLQIGDLNKLWEATIGDPQSPIEVVSFNPGDPDVRTLMNYFMCAKKNSPFFLRCHQLFLVLWAEEGGKTSTDGMHASPLLRGVPLLKMAQAFTDDDGKHYTADEASILLSDYITQGQVITMVMSIIDAEDGWNGPEYVAEHVYAMEFMVGAQLINEYTQWNGTRAFELMSLHLPIRDQAESSDQEQARKIVEACLSKSFSFKLAHGLIIRVLGETLGSLWRSNPGSDIVSDTYAHWLRFGIERWTQYETPERVPFKPYNAIKRGKLLAE
ncbi:hypothetical protein EMMF5_005967 [Cystobasidiomycetes sp. EMM_F5]